MFAGESEAVRHALIQRGQRLPAQATAYPFSGTVAQNRHRGNTTWRSTELITPVRATGMHFNRDVR
jgi:hypothetical protein